MPGQTTILVKKSDGTQVRMTMEEFRAYRANENTKTPEVESGDVEEKQEEGIEKDQTQDKEIDKSAISHQSSAISEPQIQIDKSFSDSREPIAESYVEDLPMIESPHELATTTPVKNIFIDEAVYTKTHGLTASKHENTKTQPYLDSSVGVPSIQSPKQNSVKKWTDEDHKSPLEDEMEELKKHEALEVLPDKKHDLFSEVLKNIKFPIPDDLQARLHSLISSRVKEVRTDDQFLDYVTRSTDTGGLGLESEDANQLLQNVKDVWHIMEQKKKIVTVPKIVEDKKDLKIEIEKPINPNTYKSLQIGEKKPVLQDIVQPQKTTDQTNPSVQAGDKAPTGPIEEIKNFSLVDLRRMGNDTNNNFKKILENINSLKQDSIILFMQAVQAWYESPLYRHYQGLLLQAITDQVKLKDLCTGGDRLTWDELQGLTRLLKKLRI